MSLLENQFGLRYFRLAILGDDVVARVRQGWATKHAHMCLVQWYCGFSACFWKSENYISTLILFCFYIMVAVKPGGWIINCLHELSPHGDSCTVPSTYSVLNKGVFFPSTWRVWVCRPKVLQKKLFTKWGHILRLYMCCWSSYSG